MTSQARIRRLEQQSRRALTPEARSKAIDELDAIRKTQRRQRGGR